MKFYAKVMKLPNPGVSTGKAMGFIGDSAGSGVQPLPKPDNLLGGYEHGLGVNMQARGRENVHSVGHHSTQEARVDGGE